MKLYNFILILLILAIAGCSENKEQVNGWRQLFNGVDLNDWQVKITGYPLNENYGNTFRVEDGVMKVSYESYDQFNERFGHIFHKEKFSAYLIGVEYRFVGEQAPGGPGWAIRNSGVMLHCQDPSTMGVKQDFPISIEAQLLGGTGEGERTTCNLCTPGTQVEKDGELYTQHCLNSRSETYHGDQWVRTEMLVLRDSVIKHIVERDTVLDYEKPQIGGGNVINYDPQVKEDGRLLTEGFISLQSESHPVEFRKVEIFDLDPYMDDPQQLRNILNELRNR
ncbi:DUF1080 domain-containing protein [soil metagenome]